MIGPTNLKFNTKSLGSPFISTATYTDYISPRKTSQKFRDCDKEKWIAGNMLFPRKSSAPDI